MSGDVQSAQSDWQIGVPPKHGYYLAAWRRGDGLKVSELWFNPDAIRPWWFSRGYTEESRSVAVEAEVVAWMPIPDPPGGRT